MQETDVLGYVVFEEKGNEELYLLRTQFYCHGLTRNSSHYICPCLLMILILVHRDFSNIFEVDFVM